MMIKTKNILIFLPYTSYILSINNTGKSRLVDNENDAVVSYKNILLSLKLYIIQISFFFLLYGLFLSF